MHVLSVTGARIELDLLPSPPLAELAAPPTVPVLGTLEEESPVVRASRAVFELGIAPGKAERAKPKKGPPPAVFRERSTGIVRTVYREVVLRFQPDVPAKTRRAILKKHGLRVRRTNPFVSDQVVLADPARRRGGADLVEIANDYAELEEVVFATPNFVSEFRRQARSTPLPAQWHLRNLARTSGQKKGEDVEAVAAWKTTKGKPRGEDPIVIAVLDDGVDVEHPDLRSRIWTNARRGRDRIGRDFYLPDDNPGHYDPRPKKFRYPYFVMAGNDIHGTPCAGVAAAAGGTAFGAAWRSLILPVKIFHADELAPDERVADAIRYAARYADVLSCSWTGGWSPDLELAIEDAGRIGRRGRGAAVFCATGNGNHAPVGYPAADPKSVAVGASTDQARLAPYSNVGPEVDVVAPSSGGKEGIFTTDVSYEGRGFNIGDAEAGGRDGLYTNSFGGTSSATPLAAGVAALALAANPALNRDALRQLLCDTADKIGRGYDRTGHSDEFGYGRVNAARAVGAAVAARRAAPSRRARG